MTADAGPRPAGGVAPIGGAGVPLMPEVKPEELWLGSPNVLVSDCRYTIGWQRSPDLGPGFVTVRRTALGTLKIVKHYPLTSEGWARAWRAFMKFDPAAAEKACSALARRVEIDNYRQVEQELDARSLAYLPKVVFAGGYLPADPLTAGQAYALRFLEDQIAVYPQVSAQPLLTFSYQDVQAAEVAGPGLVAKWSPEQQAMALTAFGVTGALIAYANRKMKTFLRIQTADSELFFLHTTLLPEDLRIQLSRGLGAVRDAQSAGAVRRQEPPGQEDGRSSADELTRLAGLLEAGLLTRQEFDQLKARLIAGG